MTEPVDETAIRVKALCRYVMSVQAYERCEQTIRELRGDTTPAPTIMQEIQKDAELDAALKRFDVIKAELGKREIPKQDTIKLMHPVKFEMTPEELTEMESGKFIKHRKPED